MILGELNSNKEALQNATVVVRKPYAGLTEELTYTVFERVRAGLNLPSIFGASNASKDQVTIWEKLNEYNKNNPNKAIDLRHVAHSLGASSTKNAMNWANYQGLSFDDTRAYLYVAGTSYPITNNTIGGRLSLGSYTEGCIETAAGLFKAGEVEYTVAPGDNVGTGIGLPWVSGALGLGIGNTSATGGKDGFRIPILGMLSGEHTEAYYRDRESIEFLYSKGNNWNKVNKIINNQEEKWGQVGPKTKTLQFENKQIIGDKK